MSAKSDPVVRERVLERLKRYGSVSGSSFGEAVFWLRPAGVSMRKAKRAVNSLAYSTERAPRVLISRPGIGTTLDGSRGGFTIQRLR